MFGTTNTVNHKRYGERHLQSLRHIDFWLWIYRLQYNPSNNGPLKVTIAFTCG